MGFMAWVAAPSHLTKWNTGPNERPYTEIKKCPKVAAILLYFCESKANFSRQCKVESARRYFFTDKTSFVENRPCGSCNLP